MKNIIAIALLLLTVTQISCETCTWLYGTTCPVTSLLPNPVCGAQYPKVIDDQFWSIDLCGFQNPKILTSDFYVRYTFPGDIVEISNGELHNCGFGSGVGTKQFQAHCKGVGLDNIHGVWSVKYYGALMDGKIEQNNLKTAQIEK